MKKTLTYLCAAAVALASASCSKSNEEPLPDPAIYDIVTFDGVTPDDKAPLAIFTYQVKDDSPVITLSANWNAPDELKPGTRLLLAYTTETPGESGPIAIKGLSIIPGGDIRPTATVPASEPIRLRSLWRSGNYLNLNSVITISGEASEISLYVGEETLADAVPQAYVVVGMGNGGIDTSAPRQLYASWNIESVWSLPTVTGLNVNYVDAAGHPQSILISK